MSNNKTYIVIACVAAVVIGAATFALLGNTQQKITTETKSEIKDVFIQPIQNLKKFNSTE